MTELSLAGSFTLSCQRRLSASTGIMSNHPTDVLSKKLEQNQLYEVTSLKSLWEVLSSKEFKVTRSDVKSERSSFPRASVV